MSEAGDIPLVAVVGCGHWGQNRVRSFNRLGALSVCCDSAARGRAAAAALAPHSMIVSDLGGALRADVSGVVISTPAETHYELARAALLARKDVLVEKPLASNYEQGRHSSVWRESAGSC
jgi:predicted dehydrogenase